MHWFEVLQFIGLGFICIFYPILLFVKIWSLPVYVIITYFVWIACMIGWISLGKKKKISETILPITIMVFIFTCIYASGYTEEHLEGDDWILIWLSPIFSTPAFCFIGFRISEYRQERQLQQLKGWISGLNEYYKKEIVEINKIISLINTTYSDGKQMEKLLSLLDICIEGDLLMRYTEKSVKKNMEIILKIREIASKYGFYNEIENLPLGETLRKMYKVKEDCKDKIYSEKEINTSMYIKVKEEYRDKMR